MPLPYWPLFDLRVTTPRLEIRAPNDDDLVALAELAARGIHDPATMPFLIPWTDQPSPALERGILQWGWRHRAEWTPAKWSFNGVVIVDGEIVGVQDLKGTSFAVLRTVETGSWLGRAHQGRGIGTEMRSAILHLAFDGLGALEARSGARIDNLASSKVSRALGYVDNGESFELVRGARTTQLHFRLDRDAWMARRRDDIVISGLRDCLELFGATSEQSAQWPLS
jgi:RimJ/RimL family protein N-acetyltransferase